MRNRLRPLYTPRPSPFPRLAPPPSTPRPALPWHPEGNPVGTRCLSLARGSWHHTPLVRTDLVKKGIRRARVFCFLLLRAQCSCLLFSSNSPCVCLFFKIFYMYLFTLYVMCLCFVFCDNDFDSFIVQFDEDVDNFSVFCVVE